MKPAYHLREIPRTRLSTFDVYSAGLLKHHVPALLEFDVTCAREELRHMKEKGYRMSFTGWIIHIIGATLQHHPEVAAFRYGRKKLILFNDINVSILVEKKIGGNPVPVPMVIEQADKKSVPLITQELEETRVLEITGHDVVLKRKAKASERLYYFMPGFFRRAVWKYLLRHPLSAYRKMGNVVVTTPGLLGKINGWFIQKSVHPLSFGIGSVMEKPVVIDHKVQVREILNMTILFDHDVVDGAPFARFIKDFNKAIESGEGIYPVTPSCP